MGSGASFTGTGTTRKCSVIFSIRVVSAQLVASRISSTQRRRTQSISLRIDSESAASLGITGNKMVSQILPPVSSIARARLFETGRPDCATTTNWRLASAPDRVR